jgi:hypothetical protein
MKAALPPGCRVALIVRPLDNTKVAVVFSFKVYGEGAKAQPLVRCGK